MIKKLFIICTSIVSAFVLVYASSIESCFYQTDRKIEINTWVGKSTNEVCADEENNNLNWSCADNWSNKEIPQSNDIVVFDSSSLEDSVIDMSFQIYGLEIMDTYPGTITKIENELLKVGSEGVTMKNGKLKLENTEISPKDGNLNILFASYSDNSGKNGLIVERIAFSCTEEVAERLSADITSTIAKPVDTVNELFKFVSDTTTDSYNNGINPFFNVLNLTLIIIIALIFVILFKSRRSYGYIRDKISKEPIKFIPYKILLGASTNISYRSITDLEGRYSFPVIPGSYRIEVIKDGYLPFSKKINVSQVDLFTNYVEDIELESNGIKKYDTKNSVGFVWTYKIVPKIIYIFPMILLLGILNLVYIVFGETNKLYVSISISIYIVYLFIYFFNLIKPRPQLFEVVDTENGLRIPNVLVKIIDYKENKLIDTKITNHDGFFESAIHTGDYAIFISHPGYIYPSKLVDEGRKKVIVSSRELNIYNFNPNGTKKSIYMDPAHPSKF